MLLSETIVYPLIIRIFSKSKIVQRKELNDVEDVLKIWVEKYNKALNENRAIQTQYDELIEKNQANSMVLDPPNVVENNNGGE